MFASPTIRHFLLVLASSVFCFGADSATTAASGDTREIALTVKAGVPLRVTLEEKTPIREGQPIRAILTHAVHVFDREVVPAGTTVLGRVSDVQGASGKARAKTYLRGRLRTKKEALVEFDTLVLEDGRRIALTTSVSLGAPAVIRLSAGTKDAEPEKSKDESGAVATAKTKVKSAVTNNELVRAFRSNDSGGESTKGKTAKEKGKKAGRRVGRGLRNALLAFWPFGKQHLRPRTHFTAVLEEPLDFGTARPDVEKLGRLGSAPAPDSIVQARLLETISSETAQVGSPIKAVITRPLFSPEGSLILPEGALLEGEVTQVKPAKRFGRDGKLRFRFTKIAMPSGLTQLVRGSLAAAEVDSRSRMKLDAEGGAKVAPSKKRFLAPAVSVAVLMTAVPDDEDGVPSGSTAQGALPGWSGFGLLGSAAALSTRAAAAPLGIWGAANSVYFNLLRKADELVFPKNTLLEIRFGRASDAASHESEPPPAPLTPLRKDPRTPPERSLRTR